VLAEYGHNIIDMLNKSRGGLAYTLVDVETAVGDTCQDRLRAINGVLSVRAL
jgi:D-3-phosphoglycerate dehydrogenase